MSIIDKLKKGKKVESVLDALTKKKEPESNEPPKKPSDLDVEVRELNPSGGGKAEVLEDYDMEMVEEKSVREFRTEGMHEFELDSLGTSSDAVMKAEFKFRINDLIDKNQIDDAIAVLEELKRKLTEKP
ncbi:MAG: hypothetical protein JSW02_08550 [candidate division WOR-3 bacterium]|nr:MAG: hypothetical protein JSW02_08550 [candidate division WOR-3 bacterium]